MLSHCIVLEHIYVSQLGLDVHHEQSSPPRSNTIHSASVCRGRRYICHGSRRVGTPITPPSDAIIHTRIANDERALRRIVKKFHNYASLAHIPLLPPAHGGSVDDAREAFLVELASFELALKKSLMICEAESRQVEEYQRERNRIGACSNPLAVVFFSTFPPRARARSSPQPNRRTQGCVGTRANGAQAEDGVRLGRRKNKHAPQSR